MNRVCILVEGQTEETFVSDVLGPFLNQSNIYPYAVLFRKQGGSFGYQSCRKIILNALKQDRLAYVTTLVDFYGLPKDWPGREQANSHKHYLDKADMVEKALSGDICEQLGSSFNLNRFIPYVQMHEFEALLFSNTSAWAEDKISLQLEVIKQSFSCPEDINDRYETCPSRRILNVLTNYNKIIDGIIAAKKIGLAAMRTACPHFNEWITKLENPGK
ncbi:MAG TPA: DUF4276 family protein [Anaerohalosphaeraceae bacterium]|nr:DUF4276 family protein [Anaerohalosphaeraceae bacterium]